MTVVPADGCSRHEVVILGGGPAGAACAVALCQRGFSVALVEGSRAREVWSIGESVSAACRYPLGELGLWEAFEQAGHRPSYLTQSAWGSDKLEERHSINHRLGPDYHVDRRSFDAWLRERARAAGAELFSGTDVANVRWDAGARLFTLTSPRATFVAPWLIDATGRAAWLTRRLGGRRLRAGELVCVSREYENARFEPSILVETAPNGWWYTGPLPNARASALYLTLGQEAKRAREGDGWERLVRAAPHSARRLAAATPLGSVRACSAEPARSAWDGELPFLPVGDAAAAFDPMSGSGLCFAFRSALEAASVLSAARTGRQSLFVGYRSGVEQVFAEHVRRRRELYAQERRWKDSEFWVRVQAPA